MINKSKRQGGFAHMMILVVVVVLAAVGGVGYYVMSKQKDSSSSSSKSTVSDKAVADACNKSLNDKDFCKFASNWKGLEHYKTVITSTTGGVNSTMVMEVENEDKSKMTMTDNGKETAAYITIGKDNYTKDLTDGKWTKYTSAPTTDTDKVDIKDDIDVTDFDTTTDKTEYKKIGKEACDNLTCFKYQIVDPEQPKLEQFIWFDTKDYLLRRLTTKEGADLTDMKMSYDKVSISAPSPIKTADESSAAPTQAEYEAMINAMNSQISTDETATE